MADPLRRTLLAKLRGKKSKTATAAVGFGVASNCDNREGKEKVFQQVAEEQSSTEVATSASRGKTKGSEGNTERKISVVRSDRVIVAGSTSAPCETFVQVNSLEMLSDQNADEFRGRDNEQLVGGPLQRATLQKMSERDMMSRFNEHDPRFISPTRPASFGRSDAHRHAFIPRQYTGDSIGFGIYENHGLNGDNAFGHTGHACWRDAQYFVSKNNMINIASRNGVVGGSGFSSHIDYRMIETRETGVRVDLNSTTETGRSVSRDSAQDGSLLMLSQSCGNGLTYSRSYGDSFQGPAYFPTDLTCVSYQTLNGFEANLREGMQRHNSIDSEDEDYYDNYECDTNGLQMVADPAKESPFPRLVSCEIANSLGKNSAQETDRLRTQLQEAYYLLINAMHDIGTDNQAGSTVFADQVSTSSCHSEDSVCTQSSAKALETDGCPASETPEQATLIAAPLVSRIVCETGFSKSSDVRKSTGDITMVRYTAGLHRSLSDGDVRLAADHTGSPRLVNIGTYNKECKLHIQEVPNGHILAGHYGKDSVATVNNFSGFSEVVEHEGSKTEGCAGESGPVKPPGVTVNKMQEWMHKGRLLSSEMKQRITGSTHRSVGVSEPSARKDDTAKKSALAACPRTETVENAHSTLMGKREPRKCKHNETTESRFAVNSITVSKKRNWLQQSSHKNHTTEESIISGASEGDSVHGTSPPSPSERKRTAQHHAVLHVVCTQPLRAFCPQNSMKQTGHPNQQNTNSSPLGHPIVDLTEDSDADDEGEIWYNPIPEDEESEPNTGCNVSAKVGRTQAPNSNSLRKPGNGDSSKKVDFFLPLGSPASSEVLADCLSVVGNEANHANSAHSIDRPQLHKQMFGGKVGGGPSAEDVFVPVTRSATTVPPDGTEASSVGFSPPSSPSPIKKGTSINWSFPDKIKSPRTVRKLSMKMKKLPELSRKLSVKGVSSNTSHSESQATSPKSNGTSSGMESGQSSSLTPGCSTAAAASRNVISRYHLDSSVNTQHSYKKNSSGGSKSASKGGYLSDGDSPELVTKSGKHHGENKNSKGKEPAINNSKGHGTDIDVDAFRHYSFADQPKSSQYISGLMSVHFYGAEDLKPPRIDSRDVYCAIQVDSVNKARTALLTCRTTFLDMDHTFNIELENAQHLKLVVFSWEPTPRRNKVCCHGTVVLPSLFRVTKTHQLAVKLEPRGIIYVKLNLMEQWENSLDSPDSDREPIVFGVEAWKVVEKENSGLMVPLLIDKCIREIEKRGCQVVGLYRLCGSAAVKKELREAFERDSKAVEVSENQYPDINVITGVLKDYLRELPYPLITKQLYEAVLEAMAKRPLRIGANGCENDASDSEYTVSLLEHLPDIEKATLKMLLNHLKLVASYHEVNKMTCQNLAVCFGPVLLSQRQEASSHSHRVFIDSEELASALDFKKHIEVLHYLLQLWPVMGSHTKELKLNDDTEKHLGNTNYLRRKPQQSRPQVLHLNNMDIAGVLRPRQGRLDSPSNRYAGDWSACGDSYFSSTAMNSGGEADYDDVPSEDTESDEEMTFEEVEGRSKTEGPENHIHTNPKQISKEHTYQAYMEIQDIGPSLCHQVNLRDLQESIDTLIGNLERELNKNKLNAGFKASNGLKQENPF
ncbi:rho GTPase-activating protein SYDE2 [Erpetoichthys calabaricus]|uniref:Synapse defective Rho GTPase homolog 2 n=1 Tax=Erpetoichthys calabaricus TaxID=27687 RepID=A0A8C4SF96_ERPCA|nr:rho GTPase-activating protein SYDE2 [Erpetoichthys calabaricus]